MKKVKDIIVGIFKAIAIAAFSIMIVSATVQVFCRYVLSNSPMWTEELARYMFITSSLSGAVVAMDLKGHMEVDIITGKMTGTSKKISSLFSYVLIIIFCVAVTCFGIQLVQKTMSQPSPAMHIPIGLVYGTIPVGCIGMAFVALEKILELLTSKEELQEKEG